MSETIGTKPLVIENAFYTKGTIKATAATEISKGQILYFDPSDSCYKPYASGTHAIVGLAGRSFTMPSGGESSESILTAGKVDEGQIVFPSGVTIDTLTDTKETVRMQLQRMGVFCYKTHDLTV